MAKAIKLFHVPEKFVRLNKRTICVHSHLFLPTILWKNLKFEIQQNFYPQAI
jgi:hypothetical protein